MIVVATADFELYHEVVTELRSRGATFTTIEPGEALPSRTAVVLTDSDHAATYATVSTVVAEPERPRAAVERALSSLRGGDGPLIVGIDPGKRPAVAVLTGETVVAAFQVALEDAATVVHEEIADAPMPVVRVGDGARLDGARIINDLEADRIELVDETGTTPHIGAGARGMGDVLAAVNIARRAGEPVASRTIEPTAGELQRIKDRSREHSAINRSIDDALARRVATGDVTLEEALAEHGDRTSNE